MREVLRSTRSPAVYETGYRCGGTGDSAAAGTRVSAAAGCSTPGLPCQGVG